MALEQGKRDYAMHEHPEIVKPNKTYATNSNINWFLEHMMSYIL